MKKGFTRRPIEQLGFVKDINSLVVLSGMLLLTFCYLSELIIRIEEATVTLFPLPTLAPPTPLIKAKAAFSFAVHTCIQHTEPEAKPYVLTTGVGSPSTKPKPIPALVTQLLVGCRRKVVIYTWRDGEAQDVKVRLFHTVHT